MEMVLLLSLRSSLLEDEGNRRDGKLPLSVCTLHQDLHIDTRLVVDRRLVQDYNNSNSRSSNDPRRHEVHLSLSLLGACLSIQDTSLFLNFVGLGTLEEREISLYVLLKGNAKLIL